MAAFAAFFAATFSINSFSAFIRWENLLAQNAGCGAHISQEAGAVKGQNATSGQPCRSNIRAIGNHGYLTRRGNWS